MRRYCLPLVALTALLLAACESVQEVSPTPSPVATPLTETPSPTPSIVPPTPDLSGLESLITRVAEYLTASGGSPTCLADFFEQLAMPSDGTLPCIAADLDGDGEDEYAVRLVTGTCAEGYMPGSCLRGTVAVLDRQGDHYSSSLRLFEIAPYFMDGTSNNPQLLSAQDVNADGNAELAITTSECGAHTCHVSLHLLGFEEDAYVPLVRWPENNPMGVVMAPLSNDKVPQIRFEDLDDDGVAELILRWGLINSVGAGPQREATWTFRWDGEQYLRISVEYDPPDPRNYGNLRYYVVRDADDAFAAADFQGAASLYREAVENPELKDFDAFHEDGPQELLAYSWFRLSLAYLMLGDSTTASQAMDGAINGYPGTLDARAAAAFRDAFALTGDHSAACDAVTAFATENLDVFRAVWYYGYANPEFDAESLCPL